VAVAPRSRHHTPLCNHIAAASLLKRSLKQMVQLRAKCMLLVCSKLEFDCQQMVQRQTRLPARCPPYTADTLTPLHARAISILPLMQGQWHMGCLNDTLHSTHQNGKHWR